MRAVAPSMARWAAGAACACALVVPLAAHAQARDALTDGGDADPNARPAPGAVVPHQAFATSAEIGLWARAPASYGLLRPMFVAGGDVGLSSWLTLRLYGVDDFMTHAFSGMTVGLDAWLLPRTSPIQLVASTGWIENTTPGTPSAYGQVAATAAFGLFRFGASVRAVTDLAGRSNQPLLTTTAFVTYGRAVKLGLAYVEESATATTPARRAVVPSVTVSSKSGAVDFGASSSIGLSPGAVTVPVMVRIGGKF